MTHETTHKPYGTLPGEHSRTRGILAATRYLEAGVRDRTARRIFLALVACAAVDLAAEPCAEAHPDAARRAVAEVARASRQHAASSVGNGASRA